MKKRKIQPPLWRREKIADKYETFKQSNKSTSGDRKLHFSTQSS